MMITEVLLSRNAIDLFKDEPIKLEYSVNDIRSISTTGKAHFSRQFVFPSTSKNDILLNNIFDLNADSTFKPNKKVECSILVDSIEVLGGYFQLTDIQRDQFDKIIYYKATIYGYGVDLYKTLGEKELSSLDLSAYNHTRQLSTIENSWSATTGYVYPLIDYAAGFTFPAITGAIPVKLANMRPAVFVKTIWDSIFSGANYTYQSSFLNSDYFKHLIIPNSNEYLTYVPSAVTNSNLFFAYKTTDQDIIKAAAANTTFTTVVTPFGVGYVRTAFENEVTDPGNNFISANAAIQVPPPYTYIVPSDDDYSFKTYIHCGYQTGSGGVTGEVLVTIERDSTAAGVSQEVIGSASATLTVTQVVNVECSASTVSLLAGDKIYVRVRFTCGATSINQTLRIFGSNQSYFECTSSGALGQVSPIGFVDIANNLPSKVKQKDFINSIIQMYNLYVEPVGSRKLLIEPRDDFYTLGERKDWSKKHDISKPINIKLLSEVKNKSIEFLWQEDQDFFNKDYKTQTGKVYGDHKVDFDNDFVEGKETIQPIFSPTPESIIDGSRAMIIPKLYSQDSNGSYNKFGGNPRILHYSGLIDLTPYSEKWSLDYSPLGASGFQVKTFYNYPYAGHLSHPYTISGTTDLTWSAPDYIYYVNPTTGRSGYTSSGLYEKYYQKEIEEISNPKSKLVTAFFNLDSVDMASLSFKDIIFFDNDYFRLNKVEYNALGNETSKVELLKLIESKVPIPSIKYSPKRLSHSPKTGINYGENKGTSFNSVVGFGNSFSNDTLYSRIDGLNNLTYSGSNSTSVLGLNNFLAQSSGSTITGNNNLITDSVNILVSGSYNSALTASYSSIIGGSGNTLSGNNITFIGVNNYTAETQPFTTYVTYLNALSGLSVSGQSVVMSGANVGTGSGNVYAGKTGSTLFFRTLSGASNIEITTQPSVVNIGVVKEPSFSSVTALQMFSGASHTNMENIIDDYSKHYWTPDGGLNSLIRKNSAHSIKNSTYSNIISGYQNTIDNSLYCNSILAGSGNTISAGTYSTSIAAGNNITSSQSETLVSNRLRLYGGVQNKVTVVDSDYTTTLNDYCILVKTTNKVTITLISKPVDGQTYFICDYSGNAETKNITLDGNSENIQGGSTFTINNNRQSIQIIYSLAVGEWFIISDYI